MKNIITSALIVRDTKNATQLQNEMKQLDHSLSLFSHVKDIAQHGFSDVILVHESFLPAFDRKQFPGSQVIILTTGTDRVAELYPLLKNLDVFTILTWPITTNELIKHINKAY